MRQVNIGTILPRQCYPIEGQIILKDKETDAIYAIGVCQLNWDDDTIDTKYDLINVYPKLQSDNMLHIGADRFPIICRYELVARKQLVTGDVKTNNLSISGIAKINGGLQCTMCCPNAELTATLTPLFDVMCNENTLCKICVW